MKGQVAICGQYSTGLDVKGLNGPCSSFAYRSDPRGIRCICLNTTSSPTLYGKDDAITVRTLS